MGHIKEPEGVDFIINSGRLSKDQEASLSKYILEYKAIHKAKKAVKEKRSGKVRSAI